MEGYAMEDIRGGNAQENAEILLSVLKTKQVHSWKRQS